MIMADNAPLMICFLKTYNYEKQHVAFSHVSMFILLPSIMPMFQQAEMLQ
jgi:hypothetical protein